MTSIFCIASGPSLTFEDCVLVRQSGIETLAVNTSWQMVPWCNYVYAGDLKWWSAYHREIPSNIKKVTSSKKAASKYNLIFHPANGSFNSGMRALLDPFAG